MLEAEPSQASGRKAWRTVASFAPRHRAYLAKGLGLTLLGVAAQLSIPWPLKELLKGAPDATWRAELPAWFSPAWALGLLFFGLMFAAGLFDYLQRVAFSRFAIGWSRDLRAAVHAAALGAHAPELHRGDLVARLIGDIARFKASVKVTLVYVASNGLLFLAGCVIVWSLHPSFGLVFTAGFASAVLIGGLGARRSYRDFTAYREAEGQLASSLSQDGQMHAEDLEVSGDSEASEVRQQSGSAWAAHGIMGAMVAGILIVGARGIEAGDVEPSSLLLFLGYALFLSKPLVRLTRHGARVGKLVAGGMRLGRYLASASQVDVSCTRGPKPEHEVRVESKSGQTWTLPARGLVRVRDRALIEALRGDLGGAQIHVDGMPEASESLVVSVGRRNTWSVSTLDQLENSPLATCFEALGLSRLVSKRRGLAVASAEVSRGESAAVALALAGDSSASVCIVDRVDEVLDDRGRDGLREWIEVMGKERLVLVRTQALSLPAGACSL